MLIYMPDTLMANILSIDSVQKQCLAGVSGRRGGDAPSQGD